MTSLGSGWHSLRCTLLSDPESVELVFLLGLRSHEPIVLAHPWLGKSISHTQLALFCFPLTLYYIALGLWVSF